jgi:membrane protease YdiL (CAAX protease family)
VWVAMGLASGGGGLAAVATGKIQLSTRLAWPLAVVLGLGVGVVLYVATFAFVGIVERWRAFDRHVSEIYDQRRGLSRGVALILASLVTAPGEELLWRGLLQWRLGESAGRPLAALLAWGAYVAANSVSRSLPILAGAVVSGAVWGGLALWTHGVLASILCHSVWTGLMLCLPPGGPEAR